MRFILVMRAMWLMLVLVLLWMGRARGAEFSEAMARSLIAEAIEIRESGIRIASIIEGSKKGEDGFEARTVIRVTAVHPVIGDKGLGRRVRCYDFNHSPRYGWFHREIRQSRGGEEVWIWSETEGRVIVR